MDIAWVLVVMGTAAMLVRAGVVLVSTGLARAKNAAGMILRNVCDLCVTIMAFWAIGAAVAMYNGNNLFGIEWAGICGWDRKIDAQTFFYLVMVLMGTGVVGGAIAERSRFAMISVGAIILAGIVMPVGGHWVWHGWLHRMGIVDIGGATAVHLAAAVCATVAAVMVGPRGGKYNRDGSANAIPGHNIPLVGIGAMAMLVGWVPYVIGAALMHSPYVQSGDRFGTVAMNVLLAGAAGGIVSLAYGQVRYGKPEVILTLGGMLGGLVAISAGAAIVGSIAAVVIGAVAGLLVSAATLVLDVRWHVDDPSGGIAIHGVGGLWGTLAVGVFAPGTWTDRLELLAVQALGAAMVALLSAIVAIVAFAIMKMVVDLRSKEADEFDGLDLAEHDINAYPDFQQTMIKSYHLREA